MTPEWHIESLIESSRGNVCLIIRRGDEPCYKFSRIKELSSGVVRFRCTNRKCNANVFVDNETGEIVRWSNFPHCHPGLGPGDVSALKLNSLCKMRLREDSDSTAVNVFMKEVQNFEFSNIPEKRLKLLKKCLYNVRKKGEQPRSPCSSKSQKSKKVHLKSGKEKAQDSILISDDSNISSDEQESNQFPFDISSSKSGYRIFADNSYEVPLQLYCETSKVVGPTEEDSSPESSTSDFSVQVKSEPMEEGVRVKEEIIDWSEEFNAPVTVCREVQTDIDQDLEFLYSVLPMMKKLKNSDKSMVKAQIIQLIKWKAKEAV